MRVGVNEGFMLHPEDLDILLGDIDSSVEDLKKIKVLCDDMLGELEEYKYTTYYLYRLSHEEFVGPL